jgi:hypothetical protein
MGNKCSTKTPNSLLDNDLNDYDRAIFNLKREKVFYGTIAICILYGSFAIILFILSLLSDKIKYLLLNSFLPFTIVYIIGTILIILYLVGQVINFKPFKFNKDGNYDNLSCPDYWILEKVYNNSDSSNIKNAYGKSFESNAISPELFKYRCVLNNKLFNTYDIYKASSNLKPSTTEYGGKYHFFNVNCNIIGLASSNSNYDIIDDNKLINNTLYFPKKLYADIYYNNDSQSNLINTNIFKNNTALYLKYELAKAALLMNNYKILNLTSTPNGLDTSTDYTDFYKDITNTTYGSIKDDLKKLGISYLNFNYDKTVNSLSDNINDNIIRVYKKTGKARICQRPGSISNDGKGTVNNCSTTDQDNYGNLTGLEAKTIPLNCENIYPMYLASVDQGINKKDRNMDTNVIRCAYSKICGIPWSDINCDKYYD